jgi:Stress responsive A/B Barrel Domain
MKRFHHIVLFRLMNGVTNEVRQEALIKLRELGNGHQGLEWWRINESLDSRKGHIIIEEGLFSQESDYKRFHDSQKHTEAGRFMRGIADWWVGDYIE